ncbi:hypothetical protein Ami103574_12225 [Aminipila butyrica]|uniref:Uncharacterized protein n=1 Tax=Aminipila butyrica TaxID=433296 RepID=A0A858C0U0_9FIRM|nr:hypothetical protein [Aminipila butyrica]QIB70016.1 hypothetical protein Ami103574_12225 [Aminipila butyrica]
MNIQKDDIQYFINQESYSPPKKMIRSFLLLILILGMPTAIFGAYSNITSAVMLPIIMGICIWGILLLKNPINQNKLNLFLGASALSISLSTLILAYKTYASNNNHEVPLQIICFILGVYIICIAVYITIIFQWIKKGHYRQQKKYKNVKWITSGIMIIMIVSGREILGAIDRNILDKAMLLMLILVAFTCAYGGTSCFLKYYLAKKIEDEHLE